MIYLDNASTTRLAPEVLEQMLPYLTDDYGNAGTLYSLGRRAAQAIEKARVQVAEFVGSKPEQIIFTSGGTESNNLVLGGVQGFLIHRKLLHVITQQTEHMSVLRRVNPMGLFDVSILPVGENGVVRLQDVADAIREDTGFASIMYVNNETGAENPVREIGALCRERGVLFHTDCVQAAGSRRLDVDELCCDFLSLSGHKIHGPKGTGALFVREPETLRPVIVGGTSQEFGLRGGTENVAGIVGFGAACALMQRTLRETDVHTSTLKQLFYQTLESQLRAKNLGGILHVNGDLVIKHGKTLNLRLDGVDGETLLLMLDAQGVCVSAGSACESHEQNPSHVLLAMGISPEDARNSVRVSFSKYNTEEEARRAAGIFAACAAALHA